MSIVPASEFNDDWYADNDEPYPEEYPADQYEEGF
jgi:hypothetical protein